MSISNIDGNVSRPSGVVVELGFLLRSCLDSTNVNREDEV